MNVHFESMWVEPVIGSKRISNGCYASVLLLGAIGFLLVGISSYVGKDLVPFLPSRPVLFAPQGLIMCFYGAGSLSLSSYLWCTMLWGVGSGYNEFDRQKGTVSLLRWGFPGEDRRVRIRCLVQDVQAIRLETGFHSGYSVSLRLKDQQELPLAQLGEPLGLKRIEERAARLALFLRVPIEGL